MASMHSSLFATLLLAPAVVFANQYTVWSSVIFSRTGERTPEVLGHIPTTLTSNGAQQVFNSGSFFRNRYVSSTGNGDMFDSAPLHGLSANKIDPMELYVAALDQQYCVGSAQAFVQGLYPPFTLNASAALFLDPTSVMANGTYVESPLDGYQYVQVHTAGALDPEFPYLGGSLNCPAFNDAATQYVGSPEFSAIQSESDELYKDIGTNMLQDVLDEETAWDFYNAYAIYDYLNYQSVHNMTVAAQFRQNANLNTSYPVLDMLRWYADEQQYAQLGNLTAINDYSGSEQSLPDGVTGSISTIAGNLLAAKMLSQLQIAVETNGSYYKLSVLVGDFEPLLSFFALTGLPAVNSNFRGIPDFGSTAVFEVFSYTNDSMDMSFPSPDDLWVRFYFRNGTGATDDASGDFQSYSLFGRGPSQNDMTWNEFQAAMYSIMIGNIGTWCTQCGALNLFCAAWNSSDTFTGASGSSSTSSSSRQHGLKPAIAGVIGAIVTLAVAGLLFAALMLLGGVRFHRVERHKHDLGGFKGSQKLASDRDLTMPKGGAVVGASVERSPDSPISPLGHERVGSWELKQEQLERPNIAEAQSTGHPSFEEDRMDPFRDPVRAKESV
ncbi:hypothetical protein LTR10_007742 [Elasticomyces elasticus]|nr:hypothetical protein LTR10_007742 [Elasticomyces elasticus]KAK4970743.1 hypothetical protein LTR42_007719 [Elasticomyces elasticus]KAK5720786.1 hypothetical protein LTR15_006747 [Elasticomyces elasticus]